MVSEAEEDTVARGPLSGVLVADFSRILAGPYATMLLADLGADVVKVEGPGGDDTRSWVPPRPSGEGDRVGIAVLLACTGSLAPAVPDVSA